MEVYNGSEYTLLSVPYVHIASFRIMGQRKNVLATARLWAKLKLITHTTTHRQLPSFHPPPPPFQNIACSCATTLEQFSLVLREDVNRSYRQLAILLHPDKNQAPGSEEAFRELARAREDLLRNIH